MLSARQLRDSFPSTRRGTWHAYAEPIFKLTFSSHQVRQRSPLHLLGLPTERRPNLALAPHLSMKPFGRSQSPTSSSNVRSRRRSPLPRTASAPTTSSCQTPSSSLATMRTTRNSYHSANSLIFSATATAAWETSASTWQRTRTPKACSSTHLRSSYPPWTYEPGRQRVISPTRYRPGDIVRVVFTISLTLNKRAHGRTQLALVLRSLTQIHKSISAVSSSCAACASDANI